MLPGPEAHGLCVYFGMRSRGRWGGVLAGLGFMLPGFVLMFALSWAYVRYGLRMQGVATVFAAVQVAVAALIVRAVVRIGGHAITDRWLWGSPLARPRRNWPASISRSSQPRRRDLPAGAAARFAAGGVGAGRVVRRRRGRLRGGDGRADRFRRAQRRRRRRRTRAPRRFAAGRAVLVGLKAGLLTFGGAYTVIPFLQHDAVRQGAWMSNAQFLDGLALSGLLPAPLIIFSTFVGYLGGGPWGAVAMTAGIFLPAFSSSPCSATTRSNAWCTSRACVFLDRLSAGVVGLIAGTTLALLRSA